MFRILINLFLLISLVTMTMNVVHANPQQQNTSAKLAPSTSPTGSSSSVPLVASASSTSTTILNKPQQQPTLLTLEQQQELLEQLAQLQRQTQQLLAAQQSLAAVAAAAAVNGGAASGVNIPTSSGSPNLAHLHQQQFTRQHQQLSAPSIRSSNVGQQSQVKPIQIQNQQPSQAQPSLGGSQSVGQASGGSSSMAGLPQSPQINWGKCPELEPSEQEKLAKANVITKCLETTPLPANITRESVEQHREQIAACALRSEGWFTPDGAYDFGKAEKEIKNKRLQEDLESQVLNYHSQCRMESEEKYPSTNSSIIAQIQLYQACMDYFISDVCGIEVNESDTPQF